MSARFDESGQRPIATLSALPVKLVLYETTSGLPALTSLGDGPVYAAVAGRLSNCWRAGVVDEEGSMMMKSTERDEEREERIDMEAIVDTYDPEEQAMGWFCYLDEKIRFPFRALCVEERRISALKLGDEIVVVGMAHEDGCMHEMFVEVEWQDRRFGVPLVQIEALDADDDSVEAIDDWKYWVKRGYQLV